MHVTESHCYKHVRSVGPREWERVLLLHHAGSETTEMKRWQERGLSDLTALWLLLIVSWRTAAFPLVHIHQPEAVSLTEILFKISGILHLNNFVSA